MPYNAHIIYNALGMVIQMPYGLTLQVLHLLLPALFLLPLHISYFVATKVHDQLKQATTEKINTMALVC